MFWCKIIKLLGPNDSLLYNFHSTVIGSSSCKLDIFRTEGF